VIKTRRAPIAWLLTAAFLCFASVAARAASLVEIASDVNLTVNTVNSVGGPLANDSDSTTYTIVNATGTKKLVGRLSSAMPSDTTLQVHLAAPTGAISAGTVTLTASDQNLVTGIGVVIESGLDMTFTLSATVRASLVNAGSRTLTLTLVDAP
jgi:hypothetical protein